MILDSILPAIDRVGMATGAERPSYSGKHQRHGLNGLYATKRGRRVLIRSAPRSCQVRPQESSSRSR